MLINNSWGSAEESYAIINHETSQKLHTMARQRGLVEMKPNNTESSLRLSMSDELAQN